MKAYQKNTGKSNTVLALLLILLHKQLMTAVRNVVEIPQRTMGMNQIVRMLVNTFTMLQATNRAPSAGLPQGLPTIRSAAQRTPTQNLIRISGVNPVSSTSSWTRP